MPPANPLLVPIRPYGRPPPEAPMPVVAKTTKGSARGGRPPGRPRMPVGVPLRPVYPQISIRVPDPSRASESAFFRVRCKRHFEESEVPAGLNMDSLRAMNMMKKKS
jgi:hypothetical protein